MEKYEDGKNMVEHHTHYKELHGYDETVWMERGDHIRLHNKLRRIGKCNIRANVLSKIAAKAHQRTEKCRKRDRLYKKTNMRTYYLSKTVDKGIIIRIMIGHNSKTGQINVYSGFKGNHRKIHNINSNS